MQDFHETQDALKPYSTLVNSFGILSMLAVTLVLGFYVKTRVLRLQVKQFHMTVSLLIFGMVVLMSAEIGLFDWLMAAQSETQYKRLLNASIVVCSLFYGVYMLLDAGMIVK